MSLDVRDTRRSKEPVSCEHESSELGMFQVPTIVKGPLREIVSRLPTYAAQGPGAPLPLRGTS